MLANARLRAPWFPETKTKITETTVATDTVVFLKKRISVVYSRFNEDVGDMEVFKKKK